MNCKKTIKAIKDKYYYDDANGYFIRKQSIQQHQAGDIACRDTFSGYRDISFNVDGKTKNFRAHRAAFLLHHGHLPEVVDHINGIKGDNRIKNLRAATRRQNARNVKGIFTNRGVTALSNGQFCAAIKKMPVFYRLGTYKTELEAATAYNIGARKLHGEFATLNSIHEVEGVIVNYHKMGSGVGKKILKGQKIIQEVLRKTDYREASQTLHWLPPSGALKDPYELKYWKERNKKRSQPFTTSKVHRFAGVELTRKDVMAIHKTGQLPTTGKVTERHKKYDMSSPGGRFEYICKTKDSIDYNKDTGIFTRDGKPTGKKCNQGYIRITAGGKSQLAHRVAYLLTYNEWPECVDHINGNRSDNRIDNLRGCTKKQNARNRLKKRGNNSSSFVGVWKREGCRRRRTRWIASCSGQHLGSYKTEKEAARAYDVEAEKIHGEFANLNFKDCA